MNQDPFAPLQPDTISPFVGSINTIERTLEILRNTDSPNSVRPTGGPVEQSLPTPHSTVLVRNDTGGSLAALSVLKLGETLQTIATQPHDVMRLPAFKGTTPAAQSDNFAI